MFSSIRTQIRSLTLISRAIPQHNGNNSAEAPYCPPFPLDRNVTVDFFFFFTLLATCESIAAHAKLNISAAKEQPQLGCFGLADSLF